MCDDVKVELNSVNAEEDTELAEQHNEEAYPTCILQKAKKLLNPDKTSYKTLKSLLNKMLK